MNDSIGYITCTVILDAWSKNVGGNLQKYIESKPTWDNIKEQSCTIASDYFKTKGTMYDQQHKKEFDQC